MSEKLIRVEIPMCPECGGRCEDDPGIGGDRCCWGCGKKWTRHRLDWGHYAPNIDSVADVVRDLQYMLMRSPRRQNFGLSRDMLSEWRRRLAGKK